MTIASGEMMPDANVLGVVGSVVAATGRYLKFEDVLTAILVVTN